MAMILANRSWTRTIIATLRSPNPALWWVIGGAIVVLGVVLHVPFLRDAFRFSTLHAADVGICLAAGLFSILWFEILKMTGWGFRRSLAGRGGGTLPVGRNAAV